MSATAELRADSEFPKRQLVLDAATELFMAQGYGAVSMDAIARAAGVSKATLYAYFSSKDQLFATIISDACQQNIASATILPGLEMDLRTALIDFAGRLLRFLLEDRALAIHRVVISESVRFPELGRAFYDNGPGMFRRVFGEWLAGADRGRPAERPRSGSWRPISSSACCAAASFCALHSAWNCRRTRRSMPRDLRVNAFVRAYAPA